MKSTLIDTLREENHAAQIKLAAEQKAEREKQLKIYYGLIGNPEHNTPKNREVLRSCMASLGKTMQDLDQDVRVVEYARIEFADAMKCRETKEAVGKTEAELQHFRSVKRKAMEEALDAEERRLMLAEEAAKEARKEAAMGARGLKESLRKWPWVAAFFPGFETLASAFNAENYFDRLADAEAAKDSIAGPKPAA